MWCGPAEEPGLAFSWWCPPWLQSFVSLSPSVGHSRCGRSVEQGWRQQPCRWVARAPSALLPTNGCVPHIHGGWPGEMLVLVLSEHKPGLVRYHWHLGCSSPATSVQRAQQLCVPSTLRRWGHKWGHAIFSRSWEVVIVLLLSYNIFIQDMLVAVEIQFRGDWFTRLHQWCMQQSVHRLHEMDAWGVLLWV